MPDQAGTLERVALELARLMRPMASHLSDEMVLTTFADLGVQFPPAFVTDPQLVAARASITGFVGQLDTLVEDLIGAIAAEDTAGIVSKGAALIEAFVHAIESFNQLVSALQAAGPGMPGITPAQITALINDLPQKLLDLLVADILQLSAPVGAVMIIFGVLEVVPDPGDPSDPTKPAHDKTTVHLHRLLPAITNPVSHLATLYGWGSPAFDPTNLLTVLEIAVGRLGVPVLLVPAAGGVPVQLQIFGIDLSPTTSGSPPGLKVDVVIPASATATFTFPVSPPTWMADITLKGTIVSKTSGTLRPPFSVEIQPPSGQLEGSLTVGLHAGPPEPFVILGEAGGSRLEFAQFAVTGGVTLKWDSASGKATAEPGFGGGIKGGKLVIDASKGDGFLTTILGGFRMESNFDLGLTFDPATGVHFEGSAALEIKVPTHVQVGPIEVQGIYLVARLAGATVPLELSAGLSANLGPLQASVERMGAIVELGFPAGGGNAGPAQVNFAFKPPSGVGLAVNAGVVKGGGFLYIDVDKGEYAGALELMVADFLSLHAIGLISTKMPDGSSGFSLLIIITAEFASGIQLGFGFTLLAVGGLLGLNRTMLFQPIMDGVRTGAINSIMFPHDVVANAPRIISDLKAIFPPHEGTFLIGPMAKLGWGTPTLVSLSLGVIIEIPPGDIAILGVLQLALPDPDDILILIQVNFAGALEFSKKRLYFFASMYDSRVLFITIDGEMGVLVAYGDDANFLVLVGGCHPQYKPPPLPFPNPKRIQISILNESYARIRCDAYFAVTTNTVQFGSHAELFFGFDSVSITGHLGFDALVQFSPFHFIVTLSGGVALTVFGMGLFGIDIDLLLEGPTPWHAHGTASISFLFFSIGVTVDFSWGDDRQTTLPPVVVMPLLTAELQKDANWRAVLPSGSNLLVTLRKLDPAESDFTLHPVGTLHVSQRYIPLDLTLDKIGNQKPSDANRFSLAVSPNGLSKRSDLMESFAPAQFQNFGDAQKLSQAAFQPQHGGIELSASADLKSGTAITRIVRYNLTVVDTKYRRYAQKFFVLVGALFNHFLKGASVSRNTLSAYRQSQVQPFTDRVTVAPETFAVAFQSNNTVYHPAAASFSSQAAAADYLDREVARDRTLQGTLHVLPQFEVAA